MTTNEQFPADTGIDPFDRIEANILDGAALAKEDLQYLLNPEQNPHGLRKMLGAIVISEQFQARSEDDEVVSRFHALGMLAHRAEQATFKQQNSINAATDRLMRSSNLDMRPRELSSRKAIKHVRKQYEGSWGGKTPGNPRRSGTTLTSQL